MQHTHCVTTITGRMSNMYYVVHLFAKGIELFPTNPVMVYVDDVSTHNGQQTMKTQTTVKTKPDARAEAITTNLTIDWDGMTEEDTRALAQQALIVKLQSGWRNGTIPTGDHEVKATDFRVGVRAPRGPVDPVALFHKMSPEQQQEFLARIKAG